MQRLSANVLNFRRVDPILIRYTVIYKKYKNVMRLLSCIIHSNKVTFLTRRQGKNELSQRARGRVCSV